ncbi:hypothetical protein B0T18DRAFT_491575 [Schizothecium vesticola]|uniref:Uncharacterized protein n=1 Tax=Schizothecium vesticola TaxID=314040 RepID=A0AA40EKR7_9PEZI|nr:hypothetical protein B0T18DRAFT_491575 [Schizothecium vesticola]
MGCCSSSESKITGTLSKVDKIERDKFVSVESFGTNEANKKYAKFRMLLAKDTELSGKFGVVAVSMFEAVQKHWARIGLEGPDKDAVALHYELSKSNWTQHYRIDVSLCYETGKSVMLWSGPVPRVLSQGGHGEAPNPGSLCGQLAVVKSGTKSQCVTIGGIVGNDKGLWAVTAWHSAPSANRRNISYDESIKPEEYNNEVLEPPCIVQSTMTPQHRPDTQETHNQLSHRSRQDPIELELPDTETDVEREHEWRLIPLGDHRDRYLPNQFKPNSHDQKYLSLDNVAKEPRAGAVIILAAVSGQQTMNMLPGKASIRLRSNRWVETWQLEPLNSATTLPLQKGDSGSWVVDPNDGTVFGLLIAGIGGIAHLIPLQEILRKGTRATGSRSPLRLPRAGEIGRRMPKIEEHSDAAPPAKQDAIKISAATALTSTEPAQQTTQSDTSIPRQRETAKAPRRSAVTKAIEEEKTPKEPPRTPQTVAEAAPGAEEVGEAIQESPRPPRWGAEAPRKIATTEALPVSHDESYVVAAEASPKNTSMVVPGDLHFDLSGAKKLIEDSKRTIAERERTMADDRGSDPRARDYAPASERRSVPRRDRPAGRREGARDIPLAPILPSSTTKAEDPVITSPGSSRSPPAPQDSERSPPSTYQKDGIGTPSRRDLRGSDNKPTSSRYPRQPVDESDLPDRGEH